MLFEPNLIERPCLLHTWKQWFFGEYFSEFSSVFFLIFLKFVRGIFLNTSTEIKWRPFLLGLTSIFQSFPGVFFWVSCILSFPEFLIFSGFFSVFFSTIASLCRGNFHLFAWKSWKVILLILLYIIFNIQYIIYSTPAPKMMFFEKQSGGGGS